jgi:hypothetical protein
MVAARDNMRIGSSSMHAPATNTPSAMGPLAAAGNCCTRVYHDIPWSQHAVRCSTPPPTRAYVHSVCMCTLS